MWCAFVVVVLVCVFWGCLLRVFPNRWMLCVFF